MRQLLTVEKIELLFKASATQLGTDIDNGSVKNGVITDRGSKRSG